MRYFVYGYYGFGNFGDDLMLSGVVDQIRERDPEARFTVKCRAPVAGLGPDVSFLEADAIFLAHAPRWRRAARHVRSLFAGVAGHHYLVLGGGALFLDKGRFSAALFVLWSLVVRARLFGIRVVAIGVSCDLLAHPASLWLTRAIFRACDVVTVRDMVALDYVRYFGRHDARLCPDLAFAAPLLCKAAVTARPQAAPSQRRRVGLSLIDYYAAYEANEATRRLFLDRIAASLRRHESAAEYVFLSLQENEGLGDNRVYADLRNEVEFADYRRIDSAEAMFAAFAALDAVVTMRYHLALIAAAAGLRVEVLYHELKMLAVGLVPDVGLMPCHAILHAGADPIASLMRRWDRAPERADFDQLAAQAADNFAWLEPAPARRRRSRIDN